MKIDNGNLKSKLRKISTMSLVTIALIVLINISTYAESTIGTQEVETATQNIKDAVIELAMPVRFSSYVC